MNQMIKMIKQWVTPRKKPMVKFDVKQHEDGHHVDIRMSVSMFDMMMRCAIVGQAEIRDNPRTKHGPSKNQIQKLWHLHHEAGRMMGREPKNLDLHGLRID